MAKKPEIEISYKVVNSAFNKGISEIKSEVTTLNKEFALQKEQMKLSATESEKLEANITKLNKEYESAQKQTRLVESGYKNVVEIMGEGSKEAQTWANKLLDAQKNEAHLENAIKEKTDALEKSNEATKKATEEQAKLETNTKRLDTLLQATDKTLDDYVDVLGTRMVQAIRDGTASSDQLELSINKIGKTAIGTDGDLSELKRTLDRVDDGDNIDNVKEEIERMGNEADDTAPKLEEMTDVLKADALMEAADILKDISDTILDIGKQAIETAAEGEEFEGAFSQVFSGYEDEAKKAMSGVSETIKASEGRFKESFLNMTAFAKTSGMDTQEAMELSARAVEAAADYTAMYGGTLEDTTASLQSFLKGNYANDAALGISATETTRNAKANQMYGKSFKELSEDQKQLTLLSMVEEGNELSGALGQAAREADSYANVMGELDNVIEEFMKAIGDEAMEVFVGIMQSVIPIIQSIAEWFTNLNPGVKEFITILLGVTAGVGALLPIIMAVKGAMLLFGASFGPIVGIIAAVIAVITAVIYAIKNWDQILALIQQSMAEWGVIFRNIWNGIYQFGVGILNNISSFFSNTWNSIKESTSNVWTNITSSLSGAWESIKTSASEAWQGIKTAITSPFTEAWNTISGIVTNIKNALSGIKAPSIVKTGSSKILGIEIPKFGIRWNAKGGIFRQPTIIGSYGGALQGVGEAGDEAVIPLSKSVLASIGVGISQTMNNQAVIDKLDEIIDLEHRLVEKETLIDMYLNERKVAEALVNPLNDQRDIREKHQRLYEGAWT